MIMARHVVGANAIKLHQNLKEATEIGQQKLMFSKIDTVF